MNCKSVSSSIEFVDKFEEVATCIISQKPHFNLYVANEF